MDCPKCGKENNDEKNKFCKNCGTPLSKEISNLKKETSGEVIKYLYHERYKILKPFKTGGMSNIYLGEDNNFEGLTCIIKEMSDIFKDPEEKKYAIQKFKEEALILAKLRHPNIPVVSNHFIEEGNYYIVMDYIEGINLEEMLMSSVIRGLAEEDVIEWGIQICEILEYLHSHNPPIIHRDIKPSNFIRRASDGKIIIIDFGIARIFEAKKVGTLIGTPGYIAPEQYSGQIDVRSDIFALGTTLHQLLTGKDPGQGIPFDFPPVRSMRPDVSEFLEKVIEKALQREMDKRYSNSGEFRKALMELKKSRICEEPVKEVLPVIKEVKIDIEPSKRASLKLHTEKTEAEITKKPEEELKEAYIEPEEIFETGNINESPVNYLDSVQLQSFHGKATIKKVLSAFIGIDIGSDRIKILQADIDEAYFVYPSIILVAETPPDTIKDGVIIDPKTVGLFIKQILAKQNIDVKRGVVSLPQKYTKSCSFFMPELPQPKMDMAIMEEAQHYFRFPVDKAKINYEILEVFSADQIGKVKVIVWAIPNEIVDSINKTMEYAMIKPAEIQLEAFSIKNSLEIILRDYHKQYDVAVVSLGASSSSIYIIKNSKVCYTRTFSLSGKDLTDTIVNKINVNKKQAESLKLRNANMDISKSSHIEYVLFKIVEPFMNNLVDELSKSLQEYNEQFKITIPVSLLLCGGTSLLKNADRYIEKKMSLKTSRFKIPVSKKNELHKELVEELGPSFMAVFGLAMDQFLKKVDPMDLEEISNMEMPQEEPEEKENKKVKKGFWSWLKG